MPNETTEGMEDTCVINFAKGGWYPNGQARLCHSLDVAGYTGGRLMFNDESQLGCPPHSESPYAFKPAAFNYAAEKGFKRILWIDSSTWAIKPLQPIFDMIEHLGHYLTGDGWSCAQWTSDACLAKFGLTREQVRPLKTLMATTMGLHMSNERTRTFLKRWTEHSLDGVSFPGAWTNDTHQVSLSNECLGHRHDQAVASLLCRELEMETVEPGHFFSYYTGDMRFVNKSVILLCCGM